MIPAAVLLFAGLVAAFVLATAALRREGRRQAPRPVYTVQGNGLGDDE